MKTVNRYMSKTHFKIMIISLLIIFSSCKNNKEEKITLINKNVNLLKEISYEKLDNSEIEKISFQTTDLISNLINNYQIDISKINGLKENVNLNNQIKIYSLSYVIQGNVYSTSFPVIQWKNKNKIYAYNLSKSIQCDFKKIIYLKNNLYLLIGVSKFEIGEIAYVIEIDDKKINLAYPAFSRRPFLNLNAGKFTYNISNNILKFKLNDFYNKQGIIESFYKKDIYGKFCTDSILQKDIGNLMSLEYEEKGEFNLKFNGSNFENIK